TERRPELKLFVYAPAAQAIELAARAVPLVRPQPKLLDEAPLTAPRVPAGLPRGAEAAGAPLVLSSVGLVALALALTVIPGAVLGARRGGRAPRGTPLAPDQAVNEAAVVSLEDVTKRFGAAVALDGLSLQVRAGQALAFWGTNGA